MPWRRCPPTTPKASSTLTDVIEIARKAGKSVRAHLVDDPYLVAGCNDRAQLADLAAELNRRIVRRHQLAGVTVVDPATTWIDVDVTIAADVTVEPGTQLRGTTTIAEDAVVGPDNTLFGDAIGTGAQGCPHHGSEAVIRDGATVGPFAYLRPGCPARHGRQDRHLRRNQERTDRRSHQGSAPQLRRRRRDR